MCQVNTITVQPCCSTVVSWVGDPEGMVLGDVSSKQVNDERTHGLSGSCAFAFKTLEANFLASF